MKSCKTDILIIGSGIAGLVAAERLSRTHEVTVVTKGAWNHCNSVKAQGGIAAAVSKQDHWSNHFADTVTAGDFHNLEDAVKLLVERGKESIDYLASLGVSFDRDSRGQLSLGKEGAHGERRILHAGGDAIGQAVMGFLIRKVKPKIKLREFEFLVDLVVHDGRCTGAITKNGEGVVCCYQAKHTILACGGAGQLYRVTSNDASVTGDGIAAAYRAGATVTDMEFVQFHPTMLTIEQDRVGLISEAVRGEGARLVSEDGRFIMDGIHEQKDLAPRSIVAQAIHQTLLAGESVFLDISMIRSFSQRFPTVTKICREAGIDVDGGFLPVEPGAHFLMGGVLTDQHGRTGLPGLYAVGETACTGVHGANRLASNSLLEGIVFAQETARTILAEDRAYSSAGTEENTYNVYSPSERGIVLPSKQAIQDMMTDHVGIVRDHSGLTRAKSWFEQYAPFFTEINNEWPVESIERINMLTTGWLITTSALERTESRGGHFRKDYPHKSKRWYKKRIERRKTDEPSQIERKATAVFP